MVDEPKLARHIIISVDPDSGDVTWDCEGFDTYEAVGLLECVAVQLKFEFMEGTSEELD